MRIGENACAISPRTFVERRDATHRRPHWQTHQPRKSSTEPHRPLPEDPRRRRDAVPAGQPLQEVRRHVPRVRAWRAASASRRSRWRTSSSATRGELHVFSIVHQSAPGIPTPYVAAIVDLPEGVSVRCNISGVEPDPKNLKFGMPVQFVTEKIRTDREGNDVIAFSFKPA